MTAAQQLARHASENAYMAYAYTEGAYRRVASFLLGEGFTDAAVALILDSKHMRWADDEFGQGAGRKPTSGTFRLYYEKYEARIRDDVERWSE